MRSPITYTALAAALTLSGYAAADAHIGPKLQQKLQQESGPFNVVVSFNDKSSVDTVMQGLNVPFLSMQALPMAGVNVTKQQLDILAANPEVSSIYFNAPLEYSNYTSGEITGGHFVHDNYGVDGTGVTIAVLDSGVDATHPDLEFGSKTIENVKIIGDLDLAGGINVFAEGTLNSDTSSGHGTHVAGTVAGSGAASANDERRENYNDGIAPGATLVGLGAGEGLNILYGLLGFDYAIANQDRLGIDIITNSWGGGDGAEFDPNNPINQASYLAYRNGMVVSFAASNSGPDEDTLNQYAIPPWVINVAAGDPNKELADFSSRGLEGHIWKKPDITAPGDGITSTRAPNTAIGALGPVVDPNHPEYYLYYHTISGTSMATPFIAGTAALLLSVNPDLSPDQIEEILKATADPMAGYKEHEVGSGYVNVKAAIDMARNVTGERLSFEQGNTDWSSQGFWSQGDDTDVLVDYIGRFKEKSLITAFGGGYVESKGKHSTVKASFRGDAIKIHFLSGPKGGLVDVVVDGKTLKTVSLYREQGFGGLVVTPIKGLTDDTHEIELRSVKDKMYFDRFEIDGALVDNGVTYVEQTETYSGVMGPSAENLEVAEFPFDVASNVVQIQSSLSWDGVADLDFYLVDPAGNEVASSASLSNPEALSFDVKDSGTYTLRVTGYISALTNYQVTNTLTSAQ
ncbi:S8 family serine peptidase [Pleionea mediterranea]|uniref:Subtilase family protein n=1 Tax=Pleionea mediterranea TaxID=523701 RepID=A0A316FZ08_9GAMM|nr:S8 family serine peptidase [Pleionea mediterranea]PWK52926.1 subtilase family protein [Pleionea mediterranea]